MSHSGKLATALFGGFFIALVQAADIEWSAPKTTVNEDDIDLTGVAVHAGYWGDDKGALSVSSGVETIKFEYRGNAGQQDGTDAGSVASMNTGYALSLTDAVFVSTGAVEDADFQTMMDGSVVDGEGQTLLLTGLTKGREYQIQLFASDNRPIDGDRTQRYGDGEGNYSDVFALNTSSSVIGSFAADASGTQVIQIEGVSDPGRQVIQGYALRAVSEPDSIAFIGLGGLALRLRSAE